MNSNNYQPTNKEIIYEIGNEIKLRLKSEYKGKVKPLLEKSKLFGEMALATSIVPYIIPTTLRSLKDVGESPSESNCNSSWDVLSMAAGFVLGFVGWSSQLDLLSKAVEKYNIPELFLIPVATNVSSGVYEIGRKLCKDAEQRLLEKKNLENKLQN